MATEARSAGGESVGTERPAETPRTSPWLTHLVALLIGAAATYVLLDLRSTNDARPSEPPTRASATPTDAEAGRQDPEAVDRGTDDEAEPSESAASTDAEETAAVPSSWEWPTTAPSVWPTASAVPEPSAAAEPSSAASSAEPGPFDPGAARSALGGLAVSASACGDGSMRGRARVAVTFANSGNATVALIQGGPLSGTSVGSCIANVMRSAKVPAYSGPITTVFTTVVVK
jgi:hypothetical protein